MSRNQLHKDKLEDFKKWLDEQGISHRPGNGDYQVLQVKSHNGKYWNPIYERHDMKEHLTTVRYMDSLIARFCRDHKNKEAA